MKTNTAQMDLAREFAARIQKATGCTDAYTATLAQLMIDMVANGEARDLWSAFERTMDDTIAQKDG